MKYLNNKDLYFQAGLEFGPTPTKGIVKYEIRLFDVLDQVNPFKTYYGSFFYYDTSQRIYYDFLLYSINSEPSGFIPGHVKYHGVINVDLYDNQGTQLDTESVSLVERFRGSGLGDSTYYSIGSISIPIPSNQDLPKVSLGQTYWVSTFYYNLLSTGILRSGTTTYNVSAGAGTYNFNVAASSDNKFNIITGTTTEPKTLSLDIVCSPYMLVWWDSQGYWQSQPFSGAEYDNFKSAQRKNLRYETIKYHTTIEKRWDLKSDWVKKPFTYYSLFTSNQVWLYDFTGSSTVVYKVIPKDNDFRLSQRIEPFKFEITVENDTTYNFK